MTTPPTDVAILADYDDDDAGPVRKSAAFVGKALVSVAVEAWGETRGIVLTEHELHALVAAARSRGWDVDSTPYEMAQRLAEEANQEPGE